MSRKREGEREERSFNKLAHMFKEAEIPKCARCTG
jgi:hypothetical protein